MARAVRYTVTAGTPVVHICRDLTPFSVAVVPGAGGTMRVEVQIAPDGAWIAWSHGDVSSPKNEKETAPCHAVRFVATTANGHGEICQ